MPRVSKKVLTVCGCLLPFLVLAMVVLYPIVSMVRENAHNVQCHGHLKQLGVAFQQYAQDNDNAMPNVSDLSGHTWRGAIFRYVRSKDSYHCPGRQDTPDAQGFSQDFAANDSSKGALAGPGTAPLTRKDYPTPGKLILLLETEGNDRPDFNIDDATLFGPQTHKLWAGHFSEHGSFLFVDGHVKSLRPADTYLNDPKNSTLFNYWYRYDETKLSPNGVAVLKEVTARFGVQ